MPAAIQMANRRQISSTMQTDLTQLQNGSDIRGVALSGVLGEEVNLTTQVAERIGKAFTVWLSQKLSTPAQKLTLGLGTDSRLSAESLSTAFARGVTSLGGNVLDAGLATTPAMFMSTQFSQTKCDGAVMITASHLPFNRNGFKFFTRESGLEKKDITEILNLASINEWPQSVMAGAQNKFDLISAYSLFLCELIKKRTGEIEPFKGKKILVDAGNGAGGFFAARVLRWLGADTRGSLYLDPDGKFPNHAPNPEDEKAISSLREAVIREKADLGIIFDTDVDRAAIVDEKGKPFNRNRLIALLSAIVLQEHPGTYIVTDSVTSEGLAQFIDKLGGKHFRYKRGYRNVINKAIELNATGMECWLAIETSGHGALKENYFLDDGAYLTALILIEFAQLAREGKSLESLIESLEEPVESREYRFELLTEDFQAYSEDLIQKLSSFSAKQEGWNLETDNHEGIRVRCDSDNGDGWFLLRLSLHDPVMPLNIETQSKAGLSFIVSKLQGFLKSFEFIKTNSFT